ncbi:MAG TPA: outer membrane lipoprotein carrier protein LolA [Bacteroidia bacterium]|nr:outer membrane lipoprotein carrier protein LolA [Bacteroidia bacterium]
MKILSHQLLLIPAFLFAGKVMAQQPATNDYDPKAKTILDDVSKTAKSYSTITAEFTITTKKTDGTSDSKDGTIVLKGSKYKLTLNTKVKDKMYAEEYYNDGKTTWAYVQKDNEVTIDNAPDPNKKKEGTFSVSDIFSDPAKGFKYRFIKEETLNGKVVQQIELYPEKPDKKNYHTIKLTIDKVKKQVISAVQVNNDQSTITYTIKKFTPNLDVPDSTFQFDKKTHPGVKAIDLREDDDDGDSAK